MPTIQQLIQGSTTFYALIYTPNKQNSRKRFSENCVFKMASKQEAKSQPNKNLHSAIICGPSKSSEGYLLYYLIEWLD